MGDKAFLNEEEVAAAEQRAVDRDKYMNEKPAERTEAGGDVGAYKLVLDGLRDRVCGKRSDIADHRSVKWTQAANDPEGGRRVGASGHRGARNPLPDTYTDMSVFDRCIGSMAPADLPDGVQQQRAGVSDAGSPGDVCGNDGLDSYHSLGRPVACAGGASPGQLQGVLGGRPRWWSRRRTSAGGWH